MQLGFIGTGAITTSVIEGIVFNGHRIFTSKRNIENSSSLAKAHENVSSHDNQEVLDNSEIIFLGLTVNDAEPVLRELIFKKTQYVISFMAGVREEKLKEMVYPATFESVVIPWPAIRNIYSPLLCWPPSGRVQQIFGKSTHLIEFDHFEEFELFLVAQAVLSPMLEMTQVASKWLIDRNLNEVKVEKFLTTLLSSHLQSGTLKESIKKLSTKGGLNETLRLSLGEKGLYTDLKLGLESLYQERKK